MSGAVERSPPAPASTPMSHAGTGSPLSSCPDANRAASAGGKRTAVLDIPSGCRMRRATKPS